MSAAVVARNAAEHAMSLDSKSSNRTSTASSTTSKRSKSHIGPWRLGRTLGRGSSGRVRLAKHSTTGQLAAVKIVPKSIVGSINNSSGLPYGIEREVVIMKLIEHPNVMALYDVWENKGELYLVLEYIEGGELFDYLIRKGRLGEKEAVHYFRQIIHGVDYCHRFNICHRDLKPENLLLDKHRNIKIADFGMAALETTDHMLETSCGSPHYASPEIVAGQSYHGAPSDIWSCGIILFALLTGHLPFDDDNIRKLLLKVQAGKYTIPDELSPEAKSLIWRMLRTKPEDRITMPEILKHPLLTKYPAPVSIRKQWENNNCQVMLNANTSILDSSTGIDMEIVKNLQTLWHGVARERIIANLLKKEPNAEKTFYSLLLKYRHDHRQSISSSIGENSGTNTQKSQPRAIQKSNSRVIARKSSSQKLLDARIHPSRSNSKSSIRSVSSAHKRNVSFVKAKKSVQPRSRQSTTPSIDSDTPRDLDRVFDFTMANETATTLPEDQAVHILPENDILIPETETILTSRSPVTVPINNNRSVSEPKYVLPMIFEEDRFADAIEQELDLNIWHRNGDSTRQKRPSPHLKQPSVASPRPLPRPVISANATSPATSPPTNEKSHAGFMIYGSAASKGIKIDNQEPEIKVQRKPVNQKQVSSQSTKPLTPVKRKPLNDLNTANVRVTANLDGKEMSTNIRGPYDVSVEKSRLMTSDENKPTSRGVSFFRKLSLAPKRAPPAPPAMISSKDYGGVPSSPSEPKQSWFMKLFSPQPSRTAPPKPATKKDRVVSGSAEGKVMTFNMNPTRTRHMLVEILEDWQKYGITRIEEDGATSTIRANVSSRNVLSMRSGRFRINVSRNGATNKTIAVFIQEKGNASSFSKFIKALENLLIQADLLA